MIEEIDPGVSLPARVQGTSGTGYLGKVAWEFTLIHVATCPVEEQKYPGMCMSKTRRTMNAVHVSTINMAHSLLHAYAFGDIYALLMLRLHVQ